MPLEIIVAGARGTGLKVLQIIEDMNASGDNAMQILGFYDDNEVLHGTRFFGYPVFGTISDAVNAAKRDKIGVVCPIGDPYNRLKMIGRFELPNVVFPNVAHPTAQISRRAEVAEGNIFCQNVVVQAGAKIGRFNSFNINAVMGPLAVVQNYCTINALTMVASESVVGDFVYIGMGAKVLQRRHIGQGAVIGANAFVNKDASPWTTMVGVPARAIKTRPSPFSGS